MKLELSYYIPGRPMSSEMFAWKKRLESASVASADGASAEELEEMLAVLTKPALP